MRDHLYIFNCIFDVLFRACLMKYTLKIFYNGNLNCIPFAGHRFLDKTGLLSIVHLSIAEYTVPSRVDTFNHTVNLFAAKSLHYSLTFEPSKKTVIFVHGFNDDPYQTPGRTTAEALKKAGGYNILAWDSSSAMSLDYVSSAVNVRKIGTHLAIFLNQLTRMVKVKPENIHLVGHNLGTQISGYAGKAFYKLSL